MSATLVSRIIAWVLATLEAMVSLPTGFLGDVINGLVDTIAVVCPAIDAYWPLVVALDLSFATEAAGLHSTSTGTCRRPRAGIAQFTLVSIHFLS